MEMAARRPAEHRDENALVELRDLADARDATTPELSRGDVTNSPKPLDGERMQEAELPGRGYHQQSVRLCDATGDLGQELRPRDTDRDRQADSLTDLSPQPSRDLGRRSGDPGQPPDVEE